MKRNLGLTAAFRHAKWLAALGLTLAALVLSLVLDLSGAIQPYRLKTLDVLFRRVPLPAASPEVVVVTVDQPDLDFFKTQGITWPWRREVHAPLIAYCRWAGAKAVIFDILFTEASSYGSEDDQKFARAAAAAGSVTLPFFLTRDAKPPNPSEADLLKQAGLVDSTSEAIRMIQQGAVKLDGERVNDKAAIVEAGRVVVAQVGKRKFARISVDS